MGWVPKKSEIDRIVPGTHTIVESLNRGINFDSIQVLKSNQNKRVDQIVKTALEKQIPVSYVGPEAFSVLGKNNQGIFALVKHPPKMLDSVDDLLKLSDFNQVKSPNIYLLLDGITDPHNLGAISRSAFYFGVKGIILPKKGSVGLTPVVHKTSSGASLLMHYCCVGSLKLALMALKSRGMSIYGTGTGPNSNNLAKITCSKSSVIILGGENRGIRKTLRELADVEIGIIGETNFDSLNVSVATGIVLYQFYCKLAPFR